MAFETNLVSGALSTNGVEFPAGTERRNIPLLLRDMLVAPAGSRWEEVTAGSPTPPALQPYASTINSGNNTGTSYGYTEHVTLYLADDSGLSLGTPGARMLRFSARQYGVEAQVIDSVVADPALEANWAFAGEYDNDGFNSVWSMAFFNTGDSSTTSGTTQSTWATRAKMYYALDSEWMWCSFFYPDKTNNYNVSCGFFIYHPEPAASGIQTRTSMPWIFQIPAIPGDTGVTVSTRFAAPAGPSYSRTNNSNIVSPWVFPQTLDTASREILSPIYLKTEHSTRGTWVDDSFVPHLLWGRASLAPSGYTWQEIDVGGTPHLVVGNWSNSLGRYLLRMVA